MTSTLPTVVATEPRAVAPRQPKPDLLGFATIAEVMKFAELIQHAEGAVPKHCLGKPGKILATVMAGHELGVGPMASLRAFHVVEGKPTADYSFWIARLKAAGYRVEWPERGQERVVLKLTAPDGTQHVETWDKVRAITAGLWGKSGPWKLYPQTMLSARAVTSAGRTFAAEVLFGCYETDEAEELIRDADATVRPDPQPIAGTIAERVANAAGSAIETEAVQREAKARGCAEMAKALGLTRDDVFQIYKDLGIEHTDKTRMVELPPDALDKLTERLDAEAQLRRTGSEKSAEVQS